MLHLLNLIDKICDKIICLPKETFFLGGEIKGSLIDAMNTLAKRFEFKVKYVQARGFDNLVKNVRSMVPNIICYLL